MKSFALFCLVSLLCAASIASAEVVSLTPKDFGTTIKRPELTMVKFFAPWCGHCKKLAPEYEEAAKTLNGSKSVLGEVDCDKHKDLCNTYKVDGFPTLILFKGGEEVTKYNGPRTSQAIVQFVRGYDGPAVTTVSTKAELEKLVAERAPVALLVSKSSTSPEAEKFKALADKLRTTFTFAMVSDAAVAPEAALNSITVYRPNGEKESYSGAFDDEAALEHFFKVAQTPFLGQFSPDTSSSYVPLIQTPSFLTGVVLIDKDETDAVTALTALASEMRDTIVLYVLNASMYSDVKSFFGIPADATLPAFAVQKDQKNYVFPPSTPLTPDSVRAFIMKTQAGDVEATVRSEPVPEVETTKGLTTLVGKTLPNYLHKKDILILFYAPWCGHCKSFKPTFAAFAEKMESSPLVVGQLDATQNDYDKELFAVQGYPTIYLALADGRAIKYEGPRTEESLDQFVKEHVKTSDDSKSDL